MPRSPYYGADHRAAQRTARKLTVLVALPTLLLGSLTASAVSTATAAPSPAAKAPTVSSKHHDAMNCDPIRFGTQTAAAR